MNEDVYSAFSLVVVHDLRDVLDEGDDQLVVAHHLVSVGVLVGGDYVETLE